MLVKLIGFCALLAACSAVKVPLTVYYEALCPDSVRFITDQLYPTKQSPLGRYIDVTLIPFGKASFKTEGSDVLFTCQHGPNECYGNKVQACAIQHIQVNSYQNSKTKESLTLDYVKCLMQTWITFKDNVYPGARCAKELQLANWNVIEECANSTEGSKLLQDYGVRTQQLNPPLDSVPTIVFNHQTDKDLHELGLRDLQSAACRAMREPKPHECSLLPGGAATNVATFSLISICAAIVAFFKIF
ncbi:GILT-like protein 1 [Contarinia nasturtii]|uniref:GILT-like protein 1 n=1 Tax=Contarinia nasturtii TaxID=265458 RepID=UPI0012D47969|nr:GILT-like protein 1 [Contarinia nasturtii]